MPRRSGDKALSLAKQGAILALTNISNLLNREAFRRLNHNESTIRKAKKRIYASTDKENILLLEIVEISLPRSERPSKLNVRDRRRLVRYVTKNKTNRRKPWSIIAQEYGIRADLTAIRYTFKIAGYSRYSPRYKPPLTDN